MYVVLIFTQLELFLDEKTSVLLRPVVLSSEYAFEQLALMFPHPISVYESIFVEVKKSPRTPA